MSLLDPLIEERLRIAGFYERSEDDSRNNNLIDESGNKNQRNFEIQSEIKNGKFRNQLNQTRASVNQDYITNSPILTKNTIHNMSNNSTLLPSSIKNDMTQIEARNLFNNASPSIPHDPNNSINFTDEVPNTHRSEDYLNTSTDLEPTSRQSNYPHAFQKQQFSMSPTPQINNQTMKIFSQQPGYVDREGKVLELGKIEEIISNPKSREQSQSSAVRNQFNASGNDHAEGEMMQSRYVENDDDQKDEEYKTIDHNDPTYNESSSSNMKQIKVKVKRDQNKKDQVLKVKGKTSIRTLIKAAKSRD